MPQPWDRPTQIAQQPWERPSVAPAALPGVPKAPIPAGLQGPREQRSLLLGNAPIQQEIDEAAQTEPESAQHPIRSTLNNLGAGATRLMLSPLAHPLETAKGIAKLVSAGMRPGALTDALTPAVEQFMQNPSGEAVAAVPQAVMALAGGEDAASGQPARFLERPAEFLKNKGAQNIDRTIGSTAADFSHGAEPGRGYLEGGGGPFLSMKGAARQGRGVQATAGRGLQGAYQTATNRGVKIPTSDVEAHIQGPMDKMEAIKNGPGGSGLPGGFNEYRTNTLAPVQFNKAMGSDFSPNSLWGLRKNIAANTRWNDPSQFDLNAMRQETVGGLGGRLSEAVPESRKLNRIYQGSSNLANRAEMRANTGSTPLSQFGRRAAEMFVGEHLVGPAGMALPLLDTPIVRSGAGYGMFKAGQSLPTVPSFAPPALAAGAMGRVNKKQPDEETDER